MKLKIVCICLSFWSVVAWGQDDNTPRFSNEFLAIGIGGRALGLANTNVAFVDDVTAGFWNPAGLVNIESKYQGSLQHASLFAGIANHNYLGFAVKLDSVSSLGVSVIRFAVDDIPDTRFLFDANGAINFDNVNFFTAADYAVLISYARKAGFVKNLRFGANAKIIRRVVGDFATSWGFGLDVGVQYSFRKWDFGLTVRDITTTFNAFSVNADLLADVFTQTGNVIPENSIEITLPRAILGVSRQFTLNQNFGLKAAIDFDVTTDGRRNVLIQSDVISIDPHVGLEFDYAKLVYVRTGIGNIQDVENFDGSTRTDFQPNFGLGIKLGKVDIDYALADVGDQSEALFSHIFSIKGSFGK